MSLFGEPLRCPCLHFGQVQVWVESKSEGCRKLYWLCERCLWKLENPKTAKIEEEARQKALKT